MKKAKKTFKKAYAVICVLWAIWFTISFFDVAMHNTTTQEYLSFNFFTLAAQVL